MSDAAFATCSLCEAMCGIRVEHDGRRIESIRGDEDDPFSRGYLCPKGVALKDVVEDPDRLKMPMKRTSQGFVETSWDEALELAARGLRDVQRKHGKHAVATYLGNPSVHSLGSMLLAPLLLRTIGTRNKFSATSVDQLPHMLVAYLCLGHQLLLPIPDIDRTMLFVVFGANPLASNGSLMTAPDMRRRLRELHERGGRSVVFDPRRTETAKVASEHCFVRPGTDAYVLFALVHAVLELRAPRLGLLHGVVDGLDRVAELAKGFSPESVEPITGVAATRIRSLARELAQTDRAVVYGRVGTSTQAFGTLCQWLILVLNTITGHLDRAGGAMFTTPAIDILDLAKAFGIGRGTFGRYRSRVRGLPEFAGELPVATLAEEILEPGDGQIRALFTSAGNPVLSTPNGAQLDRALESLEHMVSVDFYLNETTRHANVILPPTAPLERWHYDLAFHALAVRNTAKLVPPIVPPRASTKSDFEILLALRLRLAKLRGGTAQRVRAELEHRSLSALGPEGIVDLLLRAGPHGLRSRHRLSAAKLRAAPHGIDLGPLVPVLPERLHTGRIDLAPSAIIADVERLRAAPKPNGELMLVGRRQLRSNNSWMHNVAPLMRGRDRCTLMIHTDDAARLQVATGARVRVTSRVGAIEVAAEVTDDVMPGVVCLPHGFGHGRSGTNLRVAAESPGASANDLTDDGVVDALAGTAVLNGVPVRVEPV